MSKRKNLVRRKNCKTLRSRERQPDQTVEVLESNTPTLCQQVRYKETLRLEKFLNDAISHKKNDILFVTGQPGSGKTEFCCYVLNKMFPTKERFRSEARVVEINCMISDTMQKVYSQLCSALQIEARNLIGLQNALKQPKVVTNLIVLLDEIDGIRNQAELESLLSFMRHIDELHTRIIILGVSNLMIPQCDAKQKVLEFTPYTWNQVHEIMNHRLLAARELNKNLISPQALKFLCLKVSKISTDIRAVNGIYSASLTEAKLRIRGSSLAPQITMSDVAKAFHQMSIVCRSLRKALPPVKPLESVILCSIYILEKKQPRICHTMRSAFYFYSDHTAHVLGVYCTKSEFMTVLENLQDNLLLSIEEFDCLKPRDERELSLNMTEKDIRGLAGDNSLLRRIIKQQLISE